MAKKWKANVELLERIARRLSRIRHKRHFNMKDWARQTRCGTAACIAGHVLLLEGGQPANYASCVGNARAMKVTNLFKMPSGSVETAYNGAMQRLKLTAEEANRLFYSDAWPDGYSRGRSDPIVAAARIRHFIATEGKE